MSAVSKALHMYLVLLGRRLITVQELSEILEVSPRMVKSYRKDLEDAGISIRTKKGRYGGYYLDDGINLKGIGITKEELDGLKMAREIIRSGNHLFSKDFETLTNKILNLQNDFESIDYFGKVTSKPAYLREKEKKLWNQVNKGIVNKKKIKLLYKSLNNDLEKRKAQNRIVHPHGVFHYEGSTYFFGYCEMRKEIRYFKLSRIENITVLEDKFTINIKYDINEILRKSFGIFDDEIFYLRLKIKYPMSELVKERQYSMNQKITEIDDANIMFEARLKGYEEVKTWVLGMGRKAEVIEPKNLKEDIKLEIEELQKMY